MATFDELASILGYDALSPMYQALGGQGNPFYQANEEGGQGQFLDARMAQTYGFDPSFFDPYTFEFQQSGPGNSGTVSAFKDGNALGSWSQYDTPFSETLRDGLLTAGAAFGGLGLAGFGPLGGALGGAGGAGGLTGLDAAALDMGAGLSGGAGGAFGSAGASALGGALPEFGMGSIGTGTGIGGGLGGLGGATGGGMDILGSLGSYFSNPSNLLNVGGNLLGGALQAYTGNKANNALQQAGREDRELQKYVFDTIQAQNKPLVDLRNAMLPQLNALMTNPGSITSDPSYKFGLDQGINALDQSAASRGMLYSGQQMKDSQKFGQDYAGTKLNDSINRLIGVSTLGQVGSSSNNQAATNYGANVGNTIGQMGSARASGYVNQGNAWGNAFGNIANNYQQQQANKQVTPNYLLGWGG